MAKYWVKVYEDKIRVFRSQEEADSNKTAPRAHTRFIADVEPEHGWQLVGKVSEPTPVAEHEPTHEYLILDTYKTGETRIRRRDLTAKEASLLSEFVEVFRQVVS